MELNATNYYTREADQVYWSASMVKTFLDCPARGLAELNGTYKRPASNALLIGSYVDAYFEGADSFQAFKDAHPEIFNSRTGELKADYKHADTMLARAHRDKLFMDYMQGEKQKILTGEIAGIPFKGKLDVYVPGKRIVDLKTVRDLESQYKPGEGRLNFAMFWNWPLQMAIYQELEGNKLPCYLAVITKEEPPVPKIIQIPQAILDSELEYLKGKLSMFDAIKSGVVEASRCEHCAYCRDTFVNKEPIQLTKFDEE